MGYKIDNDIHKAMAALSVCLSELRWDVGEIQKDILKIGYKLNEIEKKLEENAK